eukprot:jgi/Botrbrau1/11668/Bobra.168_2s0023.1
MVMNVTFLLVIPSGWSDVTPPPSFLHPDLLLIELDFLEIVSCLKEIPTCITSMPCIRGIGVEVQGPRPDFFFDPANTCREGLLYAMQHIRISLVNFTWLTKCNVMGPTTAILMCVLGLYQCLDFM